MCQVSAYVKKGEQDELLKENVTKIEVLEKGLRITTLFEGPADYTDMMLKYIDFSGGRVILEKH
ncbi:CooT family nickel-binding protein [Desulfopila inferna]|uniref:CooT family nickel-binding protein n=1 Tax=Desulfopila inferna TaxID=468528 RepID=UPI001964ACDB|nr:CooT family nickel-binding protein [Desulfopila inferna]MBM9605078.1 CooT family nickel-binding protein [Desulfopila inferna]